LDSDPDPTCAAIYRPAYPYYEDEYYELVSIVANKINQPMRPDENRPRSVKNPTYDPAKEREDNPAF
jgi:hypothetical protein